MFNDWLPFAIYGFFALVIPSTMIGASFVFATAAEAAGARPDDSVRVRCVVGADAPAALHRELYLTAMLFILFDIEIVFLYPLAVILHELAWYGFVELLVFILILVLAYVYIWRKGALEWR